MMREKILSIVLFVALSFTGQLYSVHPALGWIQQTMSQTMQSTDSNRMLLWSGFAIVFASSFIATYYLDKQEKAHLQRLKTVLKDFAIDKVIITEFNPATDGKELAQLFEQMFTGPINLSKQHRVLIARYEKMMIGFAICLCKSNSAEIEYLGVSQDFRKRGCAKKILEQTKEFFKARNIKKIKANVRAENNAMHAVCAALGIKSNYVDHFMHYSFKI